MCKQDLSIPWDQAGRTPGRWGAHLGLSSPRASCLGPTESTGGAEAGREFLALSPRLLRRAWGHRSVSDHTAWLRVGEIRLTMSPQQRHWPSHSGGMRRGSWICASDKGMELVFLAGVLKVKVIFLLLELTLLLVVQVWANNPSKSIF